MTAMPVPVLARWRARAARQGGAVLTAALVLAALALADLVTGPSGMSPGAVWQAALAGPEGLDRAAATIFWQIRLPQAVMGGIVGASLGLAGLLMQTILANPLASPFTLGFSAAAGFGAALAILSVRSSPCRCRAG
ncbi:iron chelate uptake ABC transporter family permease subunit [Rhodobacter capsulatus]|uniref:iron chelate uptake ABC transporter family permease subunit n=1 Tax=Rhodobacter capsulatus TaxID=1061 RepID=UPI0040257D15